MNIIEHKISQTFDKILSNKNLLKEIAIDIESNQSKYPNLVFAPRTKKDSVSKALLDDLQKACEANDIKITIDYVVTGHGKMAKSGNVSRHHKQSAVDIDFIILPDGKKLVVSPQNRAVVEKLTNTLEGMGYNKNAEGESNPKAFLTFGFEGHDNHVHVSNLTDTSYSGEVYPSSTGDEIDIDDTENQSTVSTNLFKDLFVQAAKTI